MEYIADLHIHSPYSRATSKESHLAGLAGWAAVKGINIIGSGDFTHPAWFKELKEQLEPAEPGLFRLKSSCPASSPLSGMASSAGQVRFLLSAEISCIYKRHGSVRKVHNLLYVPDLDSAERLNRRLAAIGNIVSDGRPILGLDSRDQLEILLEEAPEGFLVPAHIWTPWFSLFGSRSGFDSMAECFGDLESHIFALETGLSSDPAMNRLISGLDRHALISNSDCHSPAKLGREANLFNTGFDFFSLRDALKTNSRLSFRGTVEFFPEEGKYHGDGHDSCNVCFTPDESRSAAGICPVCRKPLTIGVLNRVMELADRAEPLFPPDAPEVFSLIPLQEVIAGIHGCGVGTKKVLQDYATAIRIFGTELGLLLQTPLEVIGSHSPLLGEAVARMRSGKVIRQPGFDGRYGIISLFAPGELGTTKGRAALFTG
ncbi:MAG: DNA helicase UvrD [Geobacter sp.]|nr:DNA helicase UvrD [Geobacter sp.]